MWKTATWEDTMRYAEGKIFTFSISHGVQSVRCLTKFVSLYVIIPYYLSGMMSRMCMLSFITFRCVLTLKPYAFRTGVTTTRTRTTTVVAIRDPFLVQKGD